MKEIQPIQTWINGQSVEAIKEQQKQIENQQQQINSLINR